MTDDLARELALLRDFGFTHLDLQSAARTSQPSLAAASGISVETSSASSSDPLDLDALELSLRDCTRCRLGVLATNLVFGVGNKQADLMFVGEAPGRDEDLQGEPFVGRAGQLLTDIIKAMKLSRDDVYIANVIKHRPPENRNPEPDELDACRPFIFQQIASIRPKVIVTLGRFALQSLTEKSYSISAVRGQWLEMNGIRIMPTYHPAYLLRNPSAKKEVWSDMKKVMSELGIAV